MQEYNKRVISYQKTPLIHTKSISEKACVQQSMTQQHQCEESEAKMETA